MAKSAALGLALGGIGSIAIISGIQGKSISQVLKGEIGLPPNPAVGSEPLKAYEEGLLGGVHGEAPGSGIAETEPKAQPRVQNPHGPARERAEKGTPPSPSTVGNIVAAKNYEEKLKKEIETGRITSSEAIKKFQQHFPHYEKERKEVQG